MKIGIVMPRKRPRIAEDAQAMRSRLTSLGHEVLCEEAVADTLPGCPLLTENNRPDVLVSLGGDGTLLRAAGLSARWDLPILGVNLGSRGFLAEVEPADIDKALDAVIAGQYTVETRPMLSVNVAGKGRWLAMNDAVVTRGGYARLIKVRTWVNGSLAGECRADGLIVSTPTGSTGYSLSAGGPIISPGVDCMLIIPVCAHSLHQRPQVVRGDARVRLELHSDDEMNGMLQVDGRNACYLHMGESVEIRQAEEQVRIIHLRPINFFDIVHHKLQEWTS